MSQDMIMLLLKALYETTYMVFVSTVISGLIGIPLGVILIVTDKNHILESLHINRCLGLIVNAARSTPFIILMVAIIPFTYEMTNFHQIEKGTVVNLEFDIIGKYISRIVALQS